MLLDVCAWFSYLPSPHLSRSLSTVNLGRRRILVPMCFLSRLARHGVVQLQIRGDRGRARYRIWTNNNIHDTAAPVDFFTM